jgi:hypothetical protein
MKMADNDYQNGSTRPMLWIAKKAIVYENLLLLLCGPLSKWPFFLVASAPLTDSLENTKKCHGELHGKSIAETGEYWNTPRASRRPDLSWISMLD